MTLSIMTHTQLVEAGHLIAQSEMFGRINPASGYMIACICQQKGISYLEFAETYNWMHGTASMKADAMLAKFCDLGGKYSVVRRDAECAQISVEYEGKKSTFAITWEEVKSEPFTQDKNGNTKSNYATPRKRMQSLWSRAVSDAVHTICPQACKGSYTTEEAETFVDADVKDIDRQELIQTHAQDIVGGIDYSICPIGDDSVMGKAWTELPVDLLQAALDLDDPCITDKHKNNIRVAITQKNGDGK